jgi:hypothetical protein
MRARTLVAAIVVALAWPLPPARAQILVNLVPGNFTYQFVDPTTGQPITNLTFNAVGDVKPVAVYLQQTGGSPPNLLGQLGAEGLGVRLVYNSPAGVVQVPGGSAATINANVVQNPHFDFNQKDASTSNPPSANNATHTTDTSTNVQLSDGLLANWPYYPFPGSEDPLGDSSRMLIGTFNLQAMSGGTGQVMAVDPFVIGVSDLSGPNPPGLPTGFDGEIKLDQYLSQYAANPVIPTLTVSVPPGAIPEPGTLALITLAAAGFIARRRRSTPAVAV